MILQQQQQQHENSRKAGLGQAGILNDWVLPAVEQQRQMLQQVPIQCCVAVRMLTSLARAQTRLFLWIALAGS